MIPAISSGGRMYGLVNYLAGPGRANEHTNQHVIAASSPEIFYAGGSGAQIEHASVGALAETLDQARVVFGTEVVRRDRAKLNAARERGVKGLAAVAEASVDENVWHCSLSLPPEAQRLDDAKWSAIVHEFMEDMGFTDPDSAGSRWAAVRHGLTKNGGDHVHIVASRVRDDGSVVDLWRPHPDKPGAKEGDYPRAQRVCRKLEAKHGLEVLTGRDRDVPTRGVHHAQTAQAERLDRPEREAPIMVLSRRVRAAATASESEAEFVRLVRANGLVLRPAHYDRDDPTAVTGYSVGLPASEYANRHGRPVMHGGKKLAEDLSLPRLRERWIDTDGARADARAAWEHTVSGRGTERGRTAARGTTTPDSPTAVAPAASDVRDIDARLRERLLPLARSAATEADYVMAVRTHPDVLIRPRYARGSTSEVIGYSVALRPALAAGPDGKPIWRSPSYLDPGLKLSQLRTGWPAGAHSDRLAAGAWRRASNSTANNSAVVPAPAGTGQAVAAAERWHTRVRSVVTDTQSRAWHGAAADTAGAISAAAEGISGGDRARLNQLADALGHASGECRPTRAPASIPRSAVTRVAAVMLAASRDDTTLLWLAVARQLIATSVTIADTMRAQGHARQARAITAAASAADQHFAGRTAVTAPASSQRASATPSRGTAARPTGRPPSHPHRRPEGFSR